MVREGKDIEEDDRKEVKDGKEVRIEREVRMFRKEIINNREERKGKEEGEGIMEIKKLSKRIMKEGEGWIDIEEEEGKRDRKIVDDVKNGDGDDEGKVEKVWKIDMWIIEKKESENEEEKIGKKEDGEKDVEIKLGLGILKDMSNEEKIEGRGNEDEKMIEKE